MKHLIISAAIVLSPAAALADAVQNAFLLCQVIDNTGISSSPCEVSGWSGSVTATMDTNSTQAKQMCAGMVTMLEQKNIRFDGRQWTLQIKSPYSGDKTIAYCNLPK